MATIGLILILAGYLVAVFWLLWEIKETGKPGLISGVLTILAATYLAFVAVLLGTQLSYNDWYGGATKSLVDEGLRGLEAGKTQEVLEELKRFQEAYHPTYETRANYRELAEEAASRLRSAVPQEGTEPANPR